MRLVTDQGDYHRVEVEEEHDKMETELEKGFLLVYIQLPEDLSGVQKMCVIQDFLDVEGEERCVEEQRDPVAIDKEEEGQEAMDGSFRYNVCVETVAEINRINIVTFQIAIHNREEHL